MDQQLINQTTIKEPGSHNADSTFFCLLFEIIQSQVPNGSRDIRWIRGTRQIVCRRRLTGSIF
eukprot:CAMPEP_0176147838 /NCGR_PEP_ID=MMETSP0120_2-20121206/75369_1 /TAXON_ID=160619 /ORGANISM="Kryptoperidinium foliaceum, Strain CCMP 1326" /LENGTH=62 /DNA_ID=CAMNT_0017484471 /DNA_START=14 /DNA_END=199 /DNA_ORIENTATION=+